MTVFIVTIAPDSGDPRADVLRCLLENRDNHIGAAMLDAAHRALDGLVSGLPPGVARGDEDDRLSRAEIWDAYTEHCDRTGVPEDERQSCRYVYAALAAQGFPSYRTREERGFYGVRLVA